jgi:hypothetical protein
MLVLQSIDGFQHLPYLIYFCFTLIILNIHTRIALPGRLINPMTAAALPWFTKVMIANLAQVIEPYALGIKPHLRDQVSNGDLV